MAVLSTVYLVLAGVLLIAGGIIGYELGDWAGYERGKKVGEALVAASLNAQGNELAKEAIAARTPADVPGAVQRLRANWCRDC